MKFIRMFDVNKALPLEPMSVLIAYSEGSFKLILFATNLRWKFLENQLHPLGVEFIRY